MNFALKTAVRDAGQQIQRLLLCALSIVFGVAALVAVDSFSKNLNRAMDLEAKALLGADLQITSRSSFNPEAEKLFQKIGGKQAREIRFASMAYFPKADQTRLIQLRALSGEFPFYGEFVTKPIGANPALSQQREIVLDPLLMTQYELEIGDSVRLGGIDFTITAELVSVPGEAAFAGIFAPRAYIPLSQLEATGLIGTGSIAFHRLYAAETVSAPEILVEKNKRQLVKNYLEADTVEERKQEVGRPLDNLNQFLGLVGFVALLLGGTGIAGAAQTYLQQKKNQIAILRCIGSDAQTACAVFLYQIIGIALVGAALGCILGLFAQAVLPRLLAPLLPFSIDFFISWTSVFTGFAYGLITAVIFALFPLLPLRRISPLSAIRADYEISQNKKDPLIKWLTAFTIIVLLLLCSLRTPIWWHGFAFALALGIVVSILWFASVFIKKLLKRFFKPRNYILRQAAANLHRPENSTIYLTVSLGMGTFLIYTLILIQTGLLQQTDIASQNEEPNILFFDVQPDQLSDLHSILSNYNMNIMEEAPVVTMRLGAINGESISSIKQNPDNEIDDWILNREWRSTYRDAPGPSASVTKGEYVREWAPFTEPIPISLEEEMARNLGVSINDTLSFDVQGIPMQVKISSLREVDWTEMRPNFFATFPLGVLEGAPQWWIAVARSPDIETTAHIQTDLFKQHPNISAVDLNVVLSALQDIFGRINFAIRFMGLFTVATGIIILINAISTSRYLRVRESALLRTLGASATQIRLIMAIEYCFIGLLAGTVGIFLSLAAATSLGIWLFKVDFYLPWLQVIGALLTVILLALIAGMSSSRGIANHPPLAVLRRN